MIDAYTGEKCALSRPGKSPADRKQGRREKLHPRQEERRGGGTEDRHQQDAAEQGAETGAGVIGSDDTAGGGTRATMRHIDSGVAPG